MRTQWGASVPQTPTSRNPVIAAATFELPMDAVSWSSIAEDERWFRPPWRSFAWGGGNFDSSRTEAVLVSVHLRHDELRHEELQACIDEIIALGRTIIWHEWGRVKRGI